MSTPEVSMNGQSSLESAEASRQQAIGSNSETQQMLANHVGARREVVADMSGVLLSSRDMDEMRRVGHNALK